MRRQRHSGGRPRKDKTVVIRAPESFKEALDEIVRSRGVSKDEAWAVVLKKLSNTG